MKPTHYRANSEEPVATTYRDVVVDRAGVVGEAIDINRGVTHLDRFVEEFAGDRGQVWAKRSQIEI